MLNAPVPIRTLKLSKLGKDSTQIEDSLGTPGAADIDAA